MEHAAEGTLLELLDERLPRPELRALRGHVAQCAGCSADLDRLRRLSATFDAAMALLDPAPPTRTAWASVRRRRRAGWRAGSRRVLARAAMLVLGVVGIASATLTGWPLRRWIGERLGSTAAAPSTPTDPPPPHAGAAAPAPPDAVAGVEILPADGPVRIVLQGADPALRVRVRLTGGESVEVSGTGAAAGARFRTGPGRVTVTEAGAGEIVVSLPRAVRSATVTADGRAYLVKDGDQVRVLAPSADTVGAEILFVVGP
jgi:anti-sigma factor RsiW